MRRAQAPAGTWSRAGRPSCLALQFPSEGARRHRLQLYRGRWRLILFVNVLEVLGIAGVLGNILNVDRNIELNLARLSPVFIADLLDNGTSLSGSAPVGGTTCRSHHLLRWSASSDLGARWNGVAVGNVVALAITAKLPAVKRALNGLAYDLSVDTQMRT